MADEMGVASSFVPKSPYDEIVQDGDGQVSDAAEVGVVGNESCATGSKRCCGVDRIRRRQSCCSPQPGGIFNTG